MTYDNQNKLRCQYQYEFFLIFAFYNKLAVKFLANIDSMYDAIRARIFALLKEQRISQKEFAEMLHIPAQTITDWKKGKSNSFARNLGPISKVLHTTESWLFSATGIKYIPDEQREEILQREREKARSGRYRIDLELAVDRIPDDKLNNYIIIELFEKLMQVSPEDWDLLEGIMRVMINRKEHLSEEK